MRVSVLLGARCFGALAVAAWTLSDDRLRDADGSLATAACVPLALAGWILLFAGRLAARPRSFAGWSLLLVLGQAAALQVVEAGPLVRYPRYRLEAAPAAALVVLGIQALAVGAGLWRMRRDLAGWARRYLGPWRAAAVVLPLLALGAPATPDPARFGAELLVSAGLRLLQLSTVVLAVASLRGDAWERWRPRLGAALRAARDPADGRLVAAAAVSVTVLAAALNLLAYERHPHLPDEVAFVLHARFLAEGRLTAPRPPVPEGFEVYLMNVEGDRWFPATPPGWPLVLAAGVVLGVPWLVNPLLGGLNVLLAHRLLAQLFGEPTSRLSALLLAASPWHLFLAMSFMSHTLTVLLGLLAALGIGAARRPGRAGVALAAGAAAGAASLVRPLDGLLLVALLGLWVLGAGGRRLPGRALAAWGAGALLIASLNLPYNAHLSGDPLRFPVSDYMDERFGPGSNALGFGADRGAGWKIDPWPGHGPLDAMVNSQLNAWAIDTELFGWGTGSLLLALLFGAWSGFRRRPDRLCVALLAAVLGAHAFYYFSGGPDFGARYWFLTVVPLVTLSARGALALAARCREPDRALAAVALAVLAAGLSFLPWRAIDKYHHYRGMRADPRELAAPEGVGRSLVLVRGEARSDYASAAVYNPIDLASDAPVFAWDRDPEVRRRLLAAFADRPVVVVEAPSLTGGGYEVRAGNLGPPPP